MWEQILIQAFCVVMALGGLAAVAWVVFTGQIAEQGLDAVFLALVALLAAVMFSIVPLRALQRQVSARKLLEKAPGKPAKDEQGAHA